MVGTVLDAAGITVVEVCCAMTAVSGPREVQGCNAYELLLVRAGCFTYRDARGDVFVDATTCVMGSPQQLADIAHPATGGDTFLQITLSPEVWHDLTGDEQVPLSARVSGEMQIAARVVSAASSRGAADLDLEEAALNLVGAAMAQNDPIRTASGRPATERGRRHLVEDARAVLIDNPALHRVREVALLLGCSPYHLSRIFQAQTGMTLAGYRTRLRVNLALQLLADDDVSIAEVAVQCGFSDQAHLTRVLRHWTRFTPAQARSALT
jgi:AraC-like DNA-binding protein